MRSLVAPPTKKQSKPCFMNIRASFWTIWGMLILSCYRVRIIFCLQLSREKKPPKKGGFNRIWTLELLQKLQNCLRFGVRLCQHGRRRLDKDLVLHEAHHLFSHVNVPYLGLGSLEVFSSYQ